MPQTDDQPEQPVHQACEGATEVNERLLKPSHMSPRQKNGASTPPTENGSVTCGAGRVHSNGLVVSANGGVQSHAKSHSNGYVLCLATHSL